MKFAKYLHDEAVPEWRKAYIDYKMGKRYLKTIERAIEQLEYDATSQHHIPVSLIGQVDINHQHIPEIHFQSQESIHNNTSTSHDQQHPFDQPPSPETNTDSKTPFLNTRRHNRNYSATIKFQPSNTSSVTLPGSPHIVGQQNPQDERMNKGALTFCDTSNEEPLHLQKMRRTNTSGSIFSTSAFSQSSQLLRNLTRRLTIIGNPDVPPSIRSVQVDENYFDSVLGQLLPEEREFFEFLEEQLEKINNFYREKELEAVTKLKVIKQQLYVANEWKRQYDENLAHAEAEHGWYAAEWTRVRKGINSFIRPDPGIPEDVSLSATRKNSQIPLERIDTGKSGSGGSPNMLDVERGTDYNSLQGLDSPPRNNQHQQQQQQQQHWKKRQTTFGFGVQPDELVLKEDNRRERFSHKVARTRIKAALYEFYRSLEMIKNYKVLNHTGFAKILKKFDKTAKWRASKSFLNSKLSNAYFMISHNVEDLIRETEDVFIDNFEKGHRRRGMAKLRVPDAKSRTHHFVTLRIGLYLGLAAPLLVQGVCSAFSEETKEEIPYWDKLMLVYAGLFLTILFTCLFGINMYVWAKSRINYKFIFEFDPRDNLDYQEYFEIPILFMLILSVAVYFDFGFKFTYHVATAYWPLVGIVAMSAILFCPLPIGRFTSRRWFLASIGRIIASGYYRVEFRDFFLADEMNSLTYSIEQFEFAICAYTHKWGNGFGSTCTTSRLWITPFLLAIPAWFRFLQCLRRYNDTHEWFPHLLNAGKYSSSLVTIFVNFTFRYYNTTPLRVAYIFIATFTSIFTFSWDVYMDWGLFRFGKNGGGVNGHPFLRQELVYSKVWVYYLAIVLDLFGRFTWILRIFPLGIDPFAFAFSLALFEVLRRWMWNFFRLENEHLNNCGQFRAIKDIPLPFHIRVESDSERRHGRDDDDMGRNLDEEEEEEEEEEVNRDYERRHHASIQRHDQSGNSYTFTQLPTSSPEQDSDSNSAGSNYDENFTKYGINNNDSREDRGVGQLYSDPIHYKSQSHMNIPSQHIGGRRRPLPNERLARKTLSHGDLDLQELGGKLTFATGGSMMMNDNSVRQSLYSNNLVGNQRSKTFVDSAVAEAGFKGSQLKAIESETSKSKRFYDRRDFDSKITDSGSSLRKPRKRSLTLSSLPGVQRLNAEGGSNAVEFIRSDGQGTQEGSNSGIRSQDIHRRRLSLGSRFKNTMKRRARTNTNQDDEEEDTD